jgi:hypothetical protein
MLWWVSAFMHRAPDYSSFPPYLGADFPKKKFRPNVLSFSTRDSATAGFARRVKSPILACLFLLISAPLAEPVRKHVKTFYKNTT